MTGTIASPKSRKSTSRWAFLPPSPEMEPRAAAAMAAKATAAEIGRPYGVAVDGSGNLFIADFETYGIATDSYNNRVREVNLSTGLITNFAGGMGDNGPATAAGLGGPTAVAVDSGGDFFLADDGARCARSITRQA